MQYSIKLNVINIIKDGKMKHYNLIVSLIIISFISFSCSSSQQGPKSGKKAASSKTGWLYNDRDNGGFEVNLKYKEFQAPVPGMAFVEGGTFMMGQTEENIMQDGSSTRPRAVTVTSFWMDQTEVTNVDYREYTDWMKMVFANGGDDGAAREADYFILYNRSLPDTTVWRSKYGYNEPMVENYFRHPAYNNYPVVGVSWEQAMAYCEWRTDRVNEKRLCDELGIDMQKYKESAGGRDNPSEYFTTQRYLKDPNYDLNNYKEQRGRNSDKAAGKNPKENLAAREGRRGKKAKKVSRKVRIEDGVFVPSFRLPTEAEWEYAALALIGNSHEDYVRENKIYPWNRHSVRDNVKSTQGQILANFKISQGDYMGYGGYHNDVGSLTTPVSSFMPNDFGLYDMAGNVAEWTLDVYRRETGKLDDVNPHRGNEWKDLVYRDLDGTPTETPLRVEDLESQEIAEAFGYKWNPITETVLYDINVGPQDFVKLPVDFNALYTDLEITEDLDNWTMDGASKDGVFVSDGSAPNISSEDLEDYDGLYNDPNSLRRNYKSSNNADERDGYGDGGGLYNVDSDLQMYPFGKYSYGTSSLVNNYTRVYKGGGWKDDAYWLSPGARRFLNQDLATEFIGFRCVLDHMGWESSKGPKRPRTKAKVKRK